MDGRLWLHRPRWQGWSILCLMLVGCNRHQVHPAWEQSARQTPALQSASKGSTGRWTSLWGSSTAWPVVSPSSDSPMAGQGPPKPDTLAVLAQVQLDAAFQDNTLPASREMLLDQARQGFLKALRQDPKNPTALLGLARYYARLGERSKALEVYQRYLHSYPEDKEVRHELALVHAQWKDWNGAVYWCDEALRLDPESRQIRKTKGFCLARAGRHDEALAVFQQIMPESLARYHLARVLEHLGQVEASRQQLQQALRIDPHCEPAREFLAELEAVYYHPVQAPAGHSVQPAGHTIPAIDPQSAPPTSPAISGQADGSPGLVAPLGGIPLPAQRSP